jgi:hypothetical protein
MQKAKYIPTVICRRVKTVTLARWRMIALNNGSVLLTAVGSVQDLGAERPSETKSPGLT